MDKLIQSKCIIDFKFTKFITIVENDCFQS